MKPHIIFKPRDDEPEEKPIRVYYENGIRIRVFKPRFAAGYQVEKTAR